MSPSKQRSTPQLRRVIDTIIRKLKTTYQCIDGSKLEGVGDFSCDVCGNIQGCPLGIAVVGEDTPLPTAGNIWWEAGLMHGFGKPIIAVVCDEQHLPSDFVRTYSVFYKKRGYANKLLRMAQRLTTRTDYFMKVGSAALKAGNYEKAGLLYREEYLNNRNPECIDKISELIDLVERSTLHAGYKQELVDDLTTFHQKFH